jgi:PAS domain S-box-containing protein
MTTPKPASGPPPALPLSLDALLPTISEIVSAIDLQGRLVLYNRAAEQVSGWSADEVLGRNTLWAKVFPAPGYRRRMLRRIMSAMRAGVELRDFETEITTRSGAARTISWYGAPLLDGAGRIVGGIATGRDVTESRRAQAAAERHRRQMDALNAVIHRIFLAKNLETALRDVPHVLRRRLDAAAVGLILPGGETREARLLKSGRIPLLAEAVVTVPRLLDAPLRRVLSTGRPVVLGDFRTIRPRLPVYDAMVRGGWRSAVLVPVVGRERAFGILACASREVDGFTADIGFLALMGREIGLLIERRGLAEQLANREKRLKALGAITHAVMHSARIETALRQVPRLLRRSLGAAGATLLLRETAESPPRILTDGFVPSPLDAMLLEPGLPHAPWNRRVLRTGRPVVVPDIAARGRGPAVEAMLRHGLRSLTISPLIGRQGAVFGTLGFASRNVTTLADDVEFIGAAGREIGLVIEHRLVTAELANRERRLEALHAMARAVSVSRDLARGLNQVPRILCRLLRAESGFVFLRGDGDRRPLLVTHGSVPPTVRAALAEPGIPRLRLIRRAMRTRRPVLVLDARRPPAELPGATMPVTVVNRSLLFVPILKDRRAVGVLNLAARAARRFSPADATFVAAVAREIGLLIERHRMDLQLADRERRLADLSLRLTRAAEDERHAIAALLHDDLGQMLSLARIQVDLAAKRLSEDGTPSSGFLGEIGAHLDAALDAIRDLARRLEPEILSDFDLAAALRKTVEALDATHRERLTFARRGRTRRLNSAADRALFRIALEAVQNALRHAHAQAIAVTLADRPAGLVLTVRDDGRGFDQGDRHAAAAGLGLRLMRDRARSLNADLSIRSTAGAGAVVRVAVPASPRTSGPTSLRKGGRRDGLQSPAGRRSPDVPRRTAQTPGG